MNKAPDGHESVAAKAARELAALQEKAEQARATLSRLQQDVIEAEGHLGSSQAAQLLEANEQLVLSALRARSDADTASRALDAVSRAAELDALTALPNRVLLLDRFTHAIAVARRRKGRMALLFLDLDDLKHINDTLGHAVGDQALKRVAQCLAASVRASDTVSRHGGDEFVILLPEVSQVSDAALIAAKVTAALGAPCLVGDHELRLTASIGISIYPDDGEDVATLVERADAAMYRAKRHGPGSFAFHGKEPTGEGGREAPAPDEHDRRHAQMQEANEQLVLAALSAQELQAAAEHAHRQQAEFLAVLAHELRNPLMPIRTAAVLLGRVRSEELPRVQAIIERQVAHMTRLVNDLLDVSRVSTGKLRVERRPVDITGIVDEAVHACRPAMDTRLQRFGVHLPAGPLEVQGDPVRLVQVLSNLLDNASKYTQVGGEIALSVVVVDDAIVMTVSDNGIGITAEALPHVFEAFVQDPHAVGFNGVGLGIGLMVVRELVEAHGGRVVANSAGSGLGSEFVVTLPLTGCPPANLGHP